MSQDLGLTKRPQPPREVVAVIAAAVDQLTAVVMVAPQQAPSNAWRFSGRHFGPERAVRYPRRIR